MPIETVISAYNDVFSTLKVSHLSVHSSVESKKLWQGTSEETGIESHFVEGELVISKVHKSSPAAKAGLKFGDVILEINGELGNPDQAASTSGDYLVQRKKAKLKIPLKTASFQRDEAPEILDLPHAMNGTSVAVLKIPSFRSEFFEEARWKKQIAELKKFRHVIVDLRGNLGGNFVAGLRMLSPFLCKERVIGSLRKPKSQQNQQSAFSDKLSDDHQINIVESSSEVELSTFGSYGCLQSSVQVLTDSSTASTAEMVAQALKDFKGAKIYGAPSAGQLLVGIWYTMPEIGPGVRLSIPIAIYKTQRGQVIEGPGVKVDQTLYYHIDELQRGEDSWIKVVSSRNVLK